MVGRANFGETAVFEIILSACLAGGICAERLLPIAAPTRAACMTVAQERANVWAAETDLAVSQVRCVSGREGVSVIEIAPGVFVHPGQIAVPAPENAGDMANLGFVIGSEAVAVIDAGGSRKVAEGLYAAIRRQTDLPIRWVILTHMHPDHVLGAALFREAGASIVGHHRLAQALGDRAATYLTALRRLMGDAAFLGTDLVAPDEAVPGQIDLGDRVLELATYETAHTATDVTVLDRISGTLFAGDLVFAGHVPALDGSILGWQAVLDRMADQRIDRVVPGHGPARLPWPDGADATRGYLAALTAETREAIRRGDSLRRAMEHVGESQRGGWQLFDEFNKRNATAAYTELEWE